MIATQINADFDKVEKRDLFLFISKLEQSDKSEWLKYDYKVCIKKFYKWYFKDDNPELFKIKYQYLQNYYFLKKFKN